MPGTIEPVAADCTSEVTHLRHEAEGLFILVPVERILRMMEREPDDDPAS
jgi:hypothetical protein